MKRLGPKNVDPEVIRALQQRHPSLTAAVAADIRMECKQRGEPRPESRATLVAQALRLLFVTDAFGALVLYRIKASLQRAGVPVLPRILHHWAIALAQVSIGDPVLIHPGVYLPHGQVVIDGLVEIHPNVQIRPFVTIGLREGHYIGPTIHRYAKIGAGAKLIGPITIGEGASVGANAVVLHDVPAGAVAVGVPARVVD